MAIAIAQGPEYDFEYFHLFLLKKWQEYANFLVVEVIIGSPADAFRDSWPGAGDQIFCNRRCTIDVIIIGAN